MQQSQMVASVDIPRSSRILTGIREVHKLFLTINDLAELMQRSCEVIQSTCHVPLVAIVLPGWETGAEPIAAAAGEIHGGAALLEAIKQAPDPCSCLALEPENDLGTAQPAEDCTTCEIRGIDSSAQCVCVSLRYGETSYGTLLVTHSYIEAEEDDVQHAFQELAGDIGFALSTYRQAEINRRLHTESTHLRRYVESFFELAPTGIVVLTSQGEIRRCNRSFLKLLGYTNQADVAFQSLGDLLHKVPPKLYAFLQDVTDGKGSARRLLLTFHTRRDTHVVGDSTVVRIPETHDTPGSILLVVNNITRQVAVQRKLKRTHTQLSRSEARYRSLFEDSADTVFVTAHDGTLIAINHAGAGMLGYDSPDELIGMNMARFYVNETDRRMLLGEIESRGYVKNLEVVLRTKDGRIVYGSQSATRVKESEARFPEYQGVIHDITQRIHAEQELMRRSLELSQANEELKQVQQELIQKEKLASIGKISAGVAHEINNPLGFVRSNLSSLHRYVNSFQRFLTVYAHHKDSPNLPEALSRTWKQEQLQEVLSDVPDIFSETDEGIRRIVAIVSNLKDFSRAGTEEVTTEYDINAGVQSSLIIARNEYKYVAEIEMHLDQVPAIKCNANEVNQVLLTLIINAGQAIGSTHQEDGMISISTWADEEYVHCRVDDTGPGIPHDVKDHVFDTFFTTKPAGEGTGLGLSIAYDIIVNRHHGRMRVEDSPTDGAAFILSLPRNGS